MNKLKLSPDGAERLSEREGVRRKAYLDTKGIPTIGIGHTGPEVKLGLVWSMEKVMETFKHDVRWAEDAVNSCTYPLKQNQFDALVSFVFNVGAGAFNRSTLKKLVNLGNLKAASEQFDRWKIPPEIIGRRMQEKAQFIGENKWT
jgi:lysozyme